MSKVGVKCKQIQRVLSPKPINTYSESSLNIVKDTSIKLKQKFKEQNKIESRWAVFDEATGDFVSMVEYD